MPKSTIKSIRNEHTDGRWRLPCRAVRTLRQSVTDHGPRLPGATTAGSGRNCGQSPGRRVVSPTLRRRRAVAEGRQTLPDSWTWSLNAGLWNIGRDRWTLVVEHCLDMTAGRWFVEALSRR